jgi:hypothetical protein
MPWQDEATHKQYAYIYYLEKQLNRIPAQRFGLTKQMAKTLIDDLLDELLTPSQKAKLLIDEQIAELRQKSNRHGV